MTIYYRDEIGNVVVKVDKDGIDFFDGNAIFSDGTKTYKIPVENLYYVMEDC